MGGTPNRWRWSSPSASLTSRRRTASHFTEQTLATPEQFVACLTDFGPGRRQLDVVVVREGKNLKGRVAGVLLGSVGKGVPGKALKNTIKAVEARNQLSRG